MNLLSLAAEETTLNYKLNTSVQESLQDSAHKTLCPHFHTITFQMRAAFSTAQDLQNMQRPFLQAICTAVLRPALRHLYLLQKSLSFKLAEA